MIPHEKDERNLIPHQVDHFRENVIRIQYGVVVGIIQCLEIAISREPRPKPFSVTATRHKKR